MGPLMALAALSCSMLAFAYWQLHNMSFQERIRSNMGALSALEMVLGKIQTGLMPLKSGTYQEQGQTLYVLVMQDRTISSFYWIRLEAHLKHEVIVLRSGMWHA